VLGQASRDQALMTEPEHHRGIPLGARQDAILIRIPDTAPVMKIRPPAV
jgi:hypothetical protein